METKLFYSMALMCFFAQICAGASIKISDFFKSANTVVAGVTNTMFKFLPTLEELINVKVQLLVGLPEVAIFQTIGKICSLYMAAQTIQPRILPDIKKMTLKLHASCKVISFPLNNTDKILECPEFDVNKTVVIFVTGWLVNSDVDYVTDMAHAYNCRGSYNFLALDTADSIDSLYTWSAYNTETVGRKLAVTLERLVKKVPARNIHLIGHSLGAHIVGYAGRYFSEKTGVQLTRVTGLDPANPCFYEGNELSGLQRGDAEFIDIIHSNPGSLGKLDSIGDADFYADGKNAVKPGCKKFPCSHVRAIEYYIESVFPGNEHNFLSVRCTSLSQLKRGFCKGAKFPMGYAVPRNLNGDYYLSVNEKKPFGNDSKSSNAVPTHCRKC